MRRRDKSKNIDRANVLAEQRYLKSKGLLKESLILESVDDVMRGLQNTELLGGYVLDVIPQHELLTIDISSEPDQHGKRTDEFDKFQIHYYYGDKDWDLSHAKTRPTPEDEALLNKIGGIVGAEKQKEDEYKKANKPKEFNLESDDMKEGDDEHILNEAPWNGDPNSDWVPDDDRIEVEVHEWSLDFKRTEDIDKYPDDHILVSINAASGDFNWDTEVELSSFIPHKEGKKYAPLVQQLINLNGGKDYKVSDDQLFKNPKTKEIANILDGLISDFADSYDVDYGDQYPDEDLMPGGKYDRMDEGTIKEISPDDDYDAPEFEVTLTYNYTRPADENSVEELIDSIGINYELVNVRGPYECDTYTTSLHTILNGMDLSKLEALKPDLIKISAWLDKNGGNGVFEGKVYDWVIGKFDAEINDFARTADFECHHIERMDESTINEYGIKKNRKRIKITESQRRLLKSKGFLKETVGDDYDGEFEEYDVPLTIPKSFTSQGRTAEEDYNIKVKVTWEILDYGNGGRSWSLPHITKIDPQSFPEGMQRGAMQRIYDYIKVNFDKLTPSLSRDIQRDNDLFDDSMYRDSRDTEQYDDEKDYSQHYSQLETHDKLKGNGKTF